MELSKELARQAKAKGICTPWRTELLTLDNKRQMVEMYLKGIDFCLSNNFPTNDFIRAHFKGMMEDMGVFLDDDVILENRPKCVCLGATKGRFAVNNYEVSEIFAKHNANLVVSASGHAFVMIDVFDDAVVTVEASEHAKVCVNRYGGTVQHTAADESIVKIREMNKKTY